MIVVRLVNTEFVCQPHLVIFIDETPLDTLLCSARQDLQLNGLVPTLLNWIDDKRQSEIVWKRILPLDRSRSIAPVLMCPDDLDFSCSLVVAEISASPSSVQWRRLGLDRSDAASLPDGVGTNVEWFENVGPFIFNRMDYETMLASFRDLAINSDAAEPSDNRQSLL